MVDDSQECSLLQRRVDELQRLGAKPTERERVCVGCNQFYIVSGYFLEAFTTRVFCGIVLLFVLLFVLQFQFSCIYPDDAVSQLHHFFPTEVY